MDGFFHGTPIDAQASQPSCVACMLTGSEPHAYCADIKASTVGLHSTSSRSTPESGNIEVAFIQTISRKCMTADTRAKIINTIMLKLLNLCVHRLACGGTEDNSWMHPHRGFLSRNILVGATAMLFFLVVCQCNGWCARIRTIVVRRVLERSQKHTTTATSGLLLFLLGWILNGLPVKFSVEAKQVDTDTRHTSHSPVLSEQTYAKSVLLRMISHIARSRARHAHG